MTSTASLPKRPAKPPAKVSAERMASIRRAFAHVRHPKKRAFLAALVLCGGNRRRAAKAAGVDRHIIYTPFWLEDAEFQAALKVGDEVAADVLEEAATRKARAGKSDLLTIFLLKGLRPDKYKDRLELRGSLANLDVTRLTNEQLRRIAEGEPVMAVLASTLPAEAVRGLLGAGGSAAGGEGKEG